jgi:hypothetical protein
MKNNRCPSLDQNKTSKNANDQSKSISNEKNRRNHRQNSNTKYKSIPLVPVVQSPAKGSGYTDIIPIGNMVKFIY